MASALRDKYRDNNLHVLIVKGNSGSLTLDGIEQGGERVCQEIEDEIRELEKNGPPIKKLSIVSYSLGGLFSRYAIGLLYSNGYLDRIKPMVSSNPKVNITQNSNHNSRTLSPLQHLTSEYEHHRLGI